jgi:hypothetical protein
MFTLNKKYMKTIFTLLLSTIFSLASMAYDGTRLTVTSVNTNKMFVEVDGRRYNLNGNTVTISNIRPGVHNVRVLREVRRKGNWNFGLGNKREEVVYSIKATMRTGYHFDILVNRFGKTMIDERRIDPNDDWYTDEEDDYYGNDDRNRDRDFENDRDRDLDDRDKDWDDNRNGNDRDRNDRDYDDNYNRGMNVSDFNQAKEALRKEWFENTRMTSAKQLIDRNYFTSQQVKEILFLFSFENNRLDLAKYAYTKTVDKGNYSVMNEAITSGHGREELSRYIRETR